MNAPSIARLESILGLTTEEARKVRAIIRSTESGWDAAIQIDDLGIDGFYGVEFVPRGSNSKSPAFLYLLRGETYTPTLCFVYTPGCYTCRISSWGDIVERGNYD